MNAEQKKRIAHEISNWRNASQGGIQDFEATGDRMAALLQELIKQPASVPVAYMTRDGIVASRRQVETNTASTIASGFTIPLYTCRSRQH